MTLASLGPNWAILRRPSNWFLVAFSMALLVFIYHAINKGNE